jgi:hypothetical protein
MKITPVVSPMDIKQAPPSDVKAKAIQAFKAGVSSYDNPAPTTGQAQETAVANPNQVSAEELSAIRAKTPAEVLSNAQPGTETDNTTEVEQVTEVKAKEPVKEPAVSRLYAQLAKQERALRAKAQQQEQQFKQREAALQAREAEAQQKSEINQKGFISLERLKNDPLGAMSEAGVSYDEVAQQIINPSKVDPRLQATIDALKAEIADLKKSTDEGREAMTRQQQEAYNTAVKQIETDVRNLVTADPNFELIKANRAVKDVVKLIEDTYNKDGVLLTVEEAAQEVENYLDEKITNLTKLEKIRRKLGQQTTNAAQAKKAQPAATKGPDSAPATMKTLTNAVSSTRKLSARERAILAFKGESRT